MSDIIKKQSNLSDKEMEKVSSIYEESLLIPEKKIEKPIMICIIGLIGSGKTTVVNLLVKKLPLLAISANEIRKILKEKGFDYNRAAEISFKLSEKYIKKGYSIAVDKDCNSDESKSYIDSLNKKYDIEIIWIHINPPEEFIINKFKEYRPSWLFKSTEQAIGNYKARKPLHVHENLDFNFLYVFDPSRDDLEKQINEAVDLIKKKYGF